MLMILHLYYIQKQESNPTVFEVWTVAVNPAQTQAVIIRGHEGHQG